MDRLAKQQACQLFIEQEIEKGLSAGKTKYAIGKEVAAWIKKFFEADVKPKTIAKKAERIDREIATNVASKPITENDSEKKQIQVSEPKHGDAREGAGRPPKEYHPRNGMFIAHMAVMRLKDIEDDDLERDAALDYVQDWINKNRRRSEQ
jgi:hypothetical protein